MEPSLSKIPFFESLKPSKNILLAGTGGGFDIYSGIPLYFELRALGKNVTITNLSFTDLFASTATQVFPNCFEINVHDTERSGRNYFPELHLKTWLSFQDEQPDLYAFNRVGTAPLKAAYDFLIDKHDIDTIVMVDGGTDSLMFGDEDGLGTPQEDMCSMAAVFQSKVKNKKLVSLGFGIDHYHGVSHYRFLENLAQITQDGGYLGLFHLLGNSESGLKFIDAIDYANTKMQGRQSIVGNSIASALENKFGDVHRTHRTAGSELFINPLMTIYWTFEVDAIIKRLKYYELIKDVNTIPEFDAQLVKFQRGLESTREKKPIPL